MTASQTVPQIPGVLHRDHTLPSGRWLRPSGGSVAHTAATHMLLKPASCRASVSWLWLPSTRSRSPGQFRRLSTGRRSREASRSRRVPMIVGRAAVMPVALPDVGGTCSLRFDRDPAAGEHPLLGDYIPYLTT